MPLCEEPRIVQIDGFVSAARRIDIVHREDAVRH